MSKKKLLEENTVRKFMKFANIGHLAESYLDEAGMYEEEDEMLPPEAGMENEMGMESDEDEMGMESDEDEMGMEDEMAPEEGAMGMGEKEQMLADVVAAVAETLGVEAEIEGAEMAADGEEEDDFLPADVEVEDEMPAEEEEEPMMEMAHEDDEEESVVAETVKRVTARLKKMNETAKSAKSREAMVESVVQRIMSKINKK